MTAVHVIGKPVLPERVRAVNRSSRMSKRRLPRKELRSQKAGLLFELIDWAEEYRAAVLARNIHYGRLWIFGRGKWNLVFQEPHARNARPS
jgi:hypothetical protein